MSNENVVGHQCKKLNNFNNEDELLDISHSSENFNSIDKLNLSNAHEKNNFTTSTMLTNSDDISDEKIIETNIVHGSSQLNEAECKFIIEKIVSNTGLTILNSQDENLLFELIAKMNGNISSTNTELSDINTQQFMELHLKKAYQLLNAFSQNIDLDSSKTHTIKQIDSDNSTVISPLPLINELRNPEIKNNDSIVVDDPNKLEQLNSTSPKIDLKLSTQDHYVERLGEDQDAEIIAFGAMCEKLLKIGAVDNNITMKENNQLNKHVFKQVSHNVINCSNSTKYEPSTSKLNSYKGARDNSKRVARKRHQINDLRLDSSDDSSPEYSSGLSLKQFNSKSKISKIDSKCYSNTIVIQPKNVKKIKLSNLKFEDKEVDCMLIENKLPKVQNVINDLKCKKINDDSLVQNKLLKENQTIFYFSSTGKVHNDMLNSIKKKRCYLIK
ncbi:uncharacterized protein LOC111033373 [Myzus persicae]|uniref:uncharacterized protein LOC111033373 n=1 Tax=Myzus persicae TaxID=13164 RepID=UPI000B933BFD|nr:uncharacterized protein LOC111033373 [Myzus persicae]